jgi:arylsulfatase A-like enzyme
MKKRSLVLVTVDCLRADHVGFLGYSRPVTPVLDELAESSLVFSDAIVAGAPTYFSFPSIIASRYPLSLGRDVLGVAPHESTLTTALHDAGYATAAFLAGNPYLGARSGYDQGFDAFHDFLDTALPGDSAPPSPPATNRLSNFNRNIESASRRTRPTATAYNELYFWYCQWRSRRHDPSMDQLRRYPAADVLVDQSCSWLSSLQDEPFFLWIHLMDPHHPYYPPQEALSSLGMPHITARRARFLNSFWNRGDIGPERLQRHQREIIALYDAGVYWVDKQISRLVHALQQSQRWDDTVFVVIADHGEEFLEHGARYHSPTNLPEQLIHVPLLLRAPGLPGKRLNQAPFSLIHLAPTLLQAVGVPVPGTFQGRSHWEQVSAGNLANEAAIVECIDACNNPFRVDDRMRPRLMAVRDRDYKLVLRFSDKTDLLYDLKNDPQERSPLPADALPRVRARLLQIARAHIQNARYENAGLRLRARLRDLKQSMREARANAVA